MNHREYSEADDEILIKRFTGSGDRLAFQVLVERHIGSLRKFLFTLFRGCREDIEDAEQEILMSLFMGLTNFKFRSSFKTYFYRLSKNRAIDILRKKKSLCPKIRENIQELHDSGLLAEGETASHLEACPDCRAFQDFLDGLGPSLKKELETEAAGFPSFDFNSFFKRADEAGKSGKKRMLALSLSAVLVFAIGLFSGITLYKHRQDTVLLNESAEYVVERIFSTPLMEGVELKASEGINGLSAWFSDIQEDRELY